MFVRMKFRCRKDCFFNLIDFDVFPIFRLHQQQYIYIHHLLPCFYSRNLVNKIQSVGQNGVIPGRNLVRHRHFYRQSTVLVRHRGHSSRISLGSVHLCQREIKNNIFVICTLGVLNPWTSFARADTVLDLPPETKKNS